MKKTVVFVTIFVLAIICLLPVGTFGATQNDGTITLIQDENIFYQKHNFSRVTREKAYCVGGIPENDECIKLMGGNVTGHGNWYTQTAWSGNSKYLVVEFDVMLSDKTKDVFLATGGHTPITPTVTVDDMCAKDVWGNFVAIFNTKENTSDLYFNNMPVSTGFPNVFNDGVDNHKYIRIVVTGESGSVAYINNYKMYETNSAPQIVASPVIDGYEYDSVITTDLDTSFDDLFTVSEDTSVTIYKDTTYTETLSTKDPFEKGSVVMLKNDFGYRFYYIEIDDGVYVEDSISDGTIPVRKGQAEIVYGVFGKTSDDASEKIICDGNLPCFTSYTWLNDDYEGIIRADFNIEPGNAQKIYIGTNVNMPVSDKLTLFSGRWNRVTIVYDTNSFDKTTGYGIATVYVNGVKVSETPTIFEHLAQLRVVVEGEGGSYAYVDDFSVTQFAKTQAVIPVPPVISDDIEVQNGIITQRGLSVGAITSKNPLDKIRVYKDSFYDEMLSETDLPDFGNVVVIESEDNVYSYYPVFGDLSANEVINIFQNVNAFKFQSGTTTAVTGVGGKDETDVSFNVQIAGGNYCNFNYKWENEAHSGYVVTELNIFPGTASVHLWTGEFSPYCSEIKGLNANEWNKITVVYNASKEQSGKYVTDLYVNGKFVSTTQTIAKSGDELMIFISGDVGSYVYLDDFKVYEADFIPLVTTPDISNFYYTYENNVVFDENETPLVLDIKGYSVKVFYDKLCTKPVGEKAVIPVGATVVVYDKYNNFRYYTVSDMFEKTYLAKGNGTELYGFTFQDIKCENAGGVHGRESGDISYKLTMNSKLETPNGYINFSYDNIGDSRYIVFEASAYSEADCKIRMGARYHNPISSDITTESGKYIKNQWNKIVYIFDKNDSKGSLYINGTLVSEMSSITNFPGEHKQLRFVIYAPVGTVHYMDDVEIYESAVKPTPASAGVIQPGMNYIMNSSMLYMPDDVDMASLREVFGIDDKVDVRLVKDGQTIDFSGGGKLPDKSTLVIDKGNSVITAYDISVVKNNQVIMFETGNDTGILKDGTLTVAVPVEDMSDSPTVGIVKYKEGAVVSIETINSSSFGRFKKCDISVDADQVDTIKVFVWSDNFIPLSKNGFITSK